MAEVADHPTRVAADLYASAIVEGARQSRSARQQIDHWARLGRAVSAQTSSSRRRVEEALRGEIAVGQLSPAEAVVFDAEIDAGIETGLARMDFVARLAERGVSTVSLDEEGQLREYRPDGTSVLLSTSEEPTAEGKRRR